MRHGIAIAALLAGLGGPALAETVRVRSAEHDGFTRIVVDFGDRPDWRLEPVADGVRLVAEDTDYDLQGIYRRIYRERVTEIRTDGDGALVIAFGCDCEVAPFELPNQGLMLDVALADPTAPRTAAPDLPDHDELEPLPARLLPGAFADLGSGDRQDVIERSARTARLRDAVASEFARGAAQGLVDAAPLPEPAAKPRTPEPITETVAEDAPVSAYPNLRIETQIDRDNPRRPHRLDNTACLAVPDLEIASWGDPSMFEGGLGELWLRQASDTGASDAQAQSDLARALIYMTFGAEARSLLRTAAPDTPDLAVLREVASLMDAPVAAPQVTALSDCAPMAAILTLISKTPAEVRDPGSVVAAFSALPVHLRRQLGPRLAEALVETGHVEEAITVRAAIKRGGAVRIEETGIVDAKLSRERQPEADSSAELMPVIEARAPRAAEALTLLLDHSVAAGRDVPRATLDQAIALSFETGGAAGRALDAALVRAFLQAGAYEDAARRLDALSSEPDQLSATLEAAFFERIVALPDPAEFLTVAARFKDRLVKRPGLRLQMAERLSELGLAEMARHYLDRSDAIPAADERLLRAQIAAAEDKPDIAESYLAGLSGPESDAVRAEIAALRLADPIEVETAETEVDAAAGPSLAARNRALLQRSAALRNELSGLLDP